MIALADGGVLRPRARGLRGIVAPRVVALIPLGLRLLRAIWPIPNLGRLYLVTLHDDVREVFGDDRAFHVPYRAHLDVITGGEPFILGMADGEEYRASLAALRRVVRDEDLPRLADRAEALAEAAVAASGGRAEVVDLVRRVSFKLFADYFGVPEPEGDRLALWGTRLFEFQFMGSPRDAALRAEVEAIAPAFRTHIDAEIARRRAAGAEGRDDVLARCLRLQGEGAPHASDAEIRTALLCMIVGGPPQPPMVLPQALEQLLRRPVALAAAASAARGDDDAALWRIVREAMRFDPLGPALPRIALRDRVVAQGTRRARRIPEGATVFVSFASAMMDGRRVPAPRRFDAGRRSRDYIHFGHGLHECFGLRINEATLPRMLKPLLRRPGLRRASGAEGRLSKNGFLAERLIVRFDG